MFNLKNHLILRKKGAWLIRLEVRSITLADRYSLDRLGFLCWGALAMWWMQQLGVFRQPKAAPIKDRATLQLRSELNPLESTLVATLMYSSFRFLASGQSLSNSSIAKQKGKRILLALPLCMRGSYPVLIEYHRHFNFSLLQLTLFLTCSFAPSKSPVNISVRITQANKSESSQENQFGAIVFISSLTNHQNQFSRRFSPQRIRGTNRISPKALSFQRLTWDYLRSLSPILSLEAFILCRSFRILLKAIPTRTGRSLGELSIHQRYFFAIKSGRYFPSPDSRPSAKAIFSYHQSDPSPGSSPSTPPPQSSKASVSYYRFGILLSICAPIASPITTPNMAPQALSLIAYEESCGYQQVESSLQSIAEGISLTEKSLGFVSIKRLTVDLADTGSCCVFSRVLEL